MWQTLLMPLFISLWLTCSLGGHWLCEDSFLPPVPMVTPPPCHRAVCRATGACSAFRQDSLEELEISAPQGQLSIHEVHSLVHECSMFSSFGGTILMLALYTTLQGAEAHFFLPISTIWGTSLAALSLSHSSVLLGITSQICYLHPRPCLRICFVENPN